VGDAVAVVPVPLVPIACGLPRPLLTMEIDPLRLPTPPGLNVTPIAQLLPAPTDEQVELATVNSLGLVLDTLDTNTAVPPMLVIVTLFAALVVATVWLPKLMDAAIDNWPGVATVLPVPLMPMPSPAPPERLTVNVPLREPEAEGLNAMLKLQFAPALIVAVHVFALTTNSVALPLLKLTPVAAAEPALVIVTEVGELVAPTVTDPNATGAGAACKLGLAAGQVGYAAIQNAMSSRSDASSLGAAED
jgi:hypothetical protein